MTFYISVVVVVVKSLLRGPRGGTLPEQLAPIMSLNPKSYPRFALAPSPLAKQLEPGFWNPERPQDYRVGSPHATFLAASKIDAVNNP